MKPETEAKIKYGVWGVIVGAIFAIIVGFAWGGWTTAGTTQDMAENAVLKGQAAICIAQFMSDPDSKEKLKEFEAVNSWKRSEYIAKGGWDKMPGQKEADYGVSQACSDGIELLMKK